MAGWLFDMALQIRREGHGGEEMRGENGLDGARRETDYSPSQRSDNRLRPEISTLS